MVPHFECTPDAVARAHAIGTEWVRAAAIAAAAAARGGGGGSATPPYYAFVPDGLLFYAKVRKLLRLDSRRGTIHRVRAVAIADGRAIDSHL